MPIVEQGSFMQEVRTAVDPDIYFDDTQPESATSPPEWVAAMGDDVLEQKNKLLRLLCWLRVFDVLPPTARDVRKIALYGKVEPRRVIGR